MENQISPAEAQRALRDVALSRARMGEVIRSHHGHVYLWLWGVITVFDCLGVQCYGVVAMQMPSLVFNLVGILGSIALSFLRAQTIRVQPDRRFISVAVMISIIHLAVIPAILGWPHDARASFTYSMLWWTQIYIVAGIWFSNHLLWSGLLCIIFVLAGLWVFPGIFWLWSGITIGGTLIGSGLVVRYILR